MARTEICWKTRQNKINGQSKPFIDRNLQIQIPGLDAAPDTQISTSCKSLYTHYCQNAVIITQEMAAIESELNSAISEAQKSYDAWKKMQAHLSETAAKIKK